MSNPKYDKLSVEVLNKMKDRINEKCERDLSYFAENHEKVSAMLTMINRELQLRKVKKNEH